MRDLLAHIDKASSAKLTCANLKLTAVNKKTLHSLLLGVKYARYYLQPFGRCIIR